MPFLFVISFRNHTGLPR